MNLKHMSAVVVALQLFPLGAHAQAAESGKDGSTLAALIYTFLPIVILAAVVFWYLRRVQWPKEKRTEQHMERVEQSLERIAKAVERKDKDDA